MDAPGHVPSVPSPTSSIGSCCTDWVSTITMFTVTNTDFY